MQLSNIHIYPIKSTQAVTLTEAEVTKKGLINDRRWALIGADNATLTGRNFPQLLDLKVQLFDERLDLFLANQLVQSITFPPASSERTPVQVFSVATTSLVAESAVNQWFSDYLKTNARLVFMDKKSDRVIEKRHGGDGANDVMSLADEAPVLLISEASLADLNSRLEQPITMAHFRPNLVINATAAFAEDSWQRIRIGEAEFKAGRQCKRCVFTTIDPITKEKHPQGEPLRTLNTYRKGPEGGVIFGQHLIPTKLGKVRVGDVLEIVE